MIVVLVLLAIPALSLLFLQNRQVQTRLSKHVVGLLAEELQAPISLSSVSYSFLRRVQVRDLYIEDLYGDTLLYAGVTKLRIKQFRPEPKGLTIKKITIEDAFVNLVIDSSNVVNITFITDKLKKPHVPPEIKSRVHIASINLVDARFSLSRMGHTQHRNPVDFNDFQLKKLDIKVNNLEIFRDTVRMEVESLSGMEPSGLEIHQLYTLLTINRKLLYFDNLAIETGSSNLDIPELKFDFEAFNRFKRFSYEVDLRFKSRQSELKLADLFYFVPGTGGALDRITIDGSVNGKLNDLIGDDLLVTFDDQSSLAFDFVMIGLPDFRNTFLDFSFKELNTSVLAVNDLLGTPGDSTSQFLYPWINLGNLDFAGRFTGYPDQFVASGLLATDMGRIFMDLSFQPDSVNGVDFQGRLRTNDFRLGKFLNQERDLEQLDMDIFADGNLYKGQIRADLEGTIDTLQLYKYAYSNITLDGAFTNKTFDGGFSISDPNIKMDFQGRTDFSGEVPVYKFNADVARARPYYLNLTHSDPNYFASFLIETDLSGRTIDELNGELKLVNSLFEKTDAQIQLYDVTIKARNTPDASLVQIRSDVLDADLTGQYKLTSLPGSFRNLADHFLNVIPNFEPAKDTSHYFVYNAEIKRINPLLDLFLPAVRIGDRSSISGTYDPQNMDVRLTGQFPTLQVAGNSWHNVSLNTRINNGRLESEFWSDSLTMGKNFSLDNQHFVLAAANNTAHLDIDWDNVSGPEYKGTISLSGSFQPDSLANRGFMIDLEPGNLIINNQEWNVRQASMLLRKKYLSIHNFEINSIDKKIMANGVISSEAGQDFHMDVQNLNLKELTNLTGANVDLAGKITGYINYKSVDNTPVVNTNLEVDSLYFNQQFLGKTNLDANWDDTQGSIQIKLLSEVEGIRNVEASGDFVPRSKSLDFDIRLSAFDLASLNPYASGVVNNMTGTAMVSLTLDGTLEEPELNGSIGFTRSAATFNFLNTRYVFNDRIRIYHNNLYLEDFMVEDELGNGARINGSVSNSYFRDFYISLNIDAKNLQCMNTRSIDNEVFYGNIFASGNVAINGTPNKIKLNINASTERNTALFLPLYNASEVVTSDFLTFVSEEEVIIAQAPVQATKIERVQLDLEVKVTNDAIVQLIFDPKVGDIIETRGNGNLRIMLDQSNGFRMFGDVVLEQGDYLFTLQNVINKRFKIEPGGKISFNGSPTNAAIDLEAIYTTQAAPYNLYPDIDDTKESLKKRIPVECHLILQGELGAPTISTGIIMPTADAETRSLLENSTSTDEELMKQFLSLLVINNFYSVSGFGSENMGAPSSIAGVTGSELLSNQLSNWLSQISDDFDIGVNYRPGDQITSDEVEVALSTQLLDDRIIISGNVDVGGQEMNPSSDAANNPYIMGDFDVEFRVTDNVSIIAFNRARDELLFETAPYKQGVGISYHDEFDDLNQLMARYKEGLKNRKKKKKKSSGSEMDE